MFGKITSSITGAAGLNHTYRITYEDGSSHTFEASSEDHARSRGFEHKPTTPIKSVTRV